MDKESIFEWFKRYLEHKYLQSLIKLEIIQIDNNKILFDTEIQEVKNLFQKNSLKNRKFCLCFDFENIESISADFFVFPFTKQTEEFLIKNPNFLEKNKVWILNPKSIIETIYPIHKHLLEDLDSKNVKKYLDKIKNYIPMIE
ncbi:MAG: hypothetical protein QXS41_03350 [Candidatus Woesearchaeota archaeon]